jgi:hypothetical protein
VNAQPDAGALRAFLDRASRRLAWIAAAEGAAGGLVLAIVTMAVRWSRFGSLAVVIVFGVTLALAGAAVRIVWSRRRAGAAQLVERRAPQCRNLLITAAELHEHSHVAAPVARTIYTRAARLIEQLDLAAILPARASAATLGVIATTWFSLAVSATRPASAIARALVRARASDAVIASVDVIVTPPAYAGGAARTLHDPARIEALAGSRLRVIIHARAGRVIIETLRARDSVTASAGDAFTTNLVADADGYVAVEPHGSTGAIGGRRLIGLSVAQDNGPRVRITAPGKDLFLRDAHRTLEVAVDAGDDIGLASLAVRYTKVAGSGERFTFTEGQLPIAVTRSDPRAWTARASWNLETLGLEPGDMVVYRAVATDHRPGASPSESDSFIAEVLAPGGNAAPGFDVDPEQERYAVSQQMVILKTERLAAQRAQMPPGDVANASAEIAAEQRKVRAEFVFMMGGELADASDLANMTEINEEAEAGGEDDILAGRNANQGRVALLRAIRSMSRAATSLTSADLASALPHERAALAQLERAFSHARIILRALTERERLDLLRRLTGVLTGAARDMHPRAEAEPEPRIAELRRALADVAALAGAATLDAAGASALAERVLRIDPSSREVQQVATKLSAAATDMERGRSSDARRALDESATTIAAALKAALLDAPATGGLRGTSTDLLTGALVDALRRPGGSR